jgi:hypothetical protein
VGAWALQAGDRWYAISEEILGMEPLRGDAGRLNELSRINQFILRIVYLIDVALSHRPTIPIISSEAGQPAIGGSKQLRYVITKLPSPHLLLFY